MTSLKESKHIYSLESEINDLKKIIDYQNKKIINQTKQIYKLGKSLCQIILALETSKLLVSYKIPTAKEVEAVLEEKEDYQVLLKEVILK